MRISILLLAGFVINFTARAADAPPDVRTGPLKNLNGYFPFTPSPTREAWGKRAAALRMQVLVSLGLHPLPEKTPLKSVIHGRIDCGDYSVEKVFFESMPGFFVTGSLYRPARLEGKVPAVLCPHGHWNNGRFLNQPEGQIASEIRTGAEVLPGNAASPLQSRCAGLARMGCTVFFYDMIGYADSVQFTQALAHGFKKQRPEMNDAAQWGFFSPQAEGHLQSIMGLQTWNSIRALDFLESLPEVDAKRIGVTGASGGGTQTFILGAIDPRPAAIFPCVMVSTAMQGGCTCENASLLRIGTGNVDFAAIFAPKPLGMTAADDWTKEMATKGFPELQRHFAMMGAPDNVFLHNRTEFPHNYNLPSRMAMYQWFAKHLKTPQPAPAEEKACRILTKEEASVWNAEHPAPKADDADLERAVLKHWAADAAKQVAGRPQIIDEALPVLCGRTWEQAGTCEWIMDQHDEKSDRLVMTGWIANRTHEERVAATFHYPKDWKGRVLVTPAPDAAAVDKAVQAGTAICVPQLFSDPAPGTPDTARHVDGDRDFAGYTHGYNHSITQRRAHDVLTVLTFIKNHERKPSAIDIEAAAGTLPETALALTQVEKGVVAGAKLTGDHFRFASVKDVRSPRLVPGALKYGDMPAFVQRVRAEKVTE
jgi:dienelactone hydrolase